MKRDTKEKLYKAACTELRFQERRAFFAHRARLSERLNDSKSDADW